MPADDLNGRFNDAISQQHDTASQVLRDVARVQDAKRAAESQKHDEQLDGLATVAEVAARGLADVTTVTNRVHQATEEVRDAARSLTDATDEVGGAVLLVNTSVGHVDQAVANMEVAVTKALGDVGRALAGALDEVQHEVATVTTAVDRMNNGTTRLMYVSIALAVIAVAVTIVSLI